MVLRLYLSIYLYIYFRVAEPFKWYKPHLPGFLRRKGCKESLFIIRPWNSFTKARKGKGNVIERREHRPWRDQGQALALSFISHMTCSCFLSSLGPSFQTKQGGKEHMRGVNPHYLDDLLSSSLFGGFELTLAFGQLPTPVLLLLTLAIPFLHLSFSCYFFYSIL